MKVSSLLLGAAALVGVAMAQDDFSDQLLQTLDAFPATDPIISALIASIESASDTIDKPIAIRDLISPSTRAKVACTLLKVVMPKYYTDNSSTTAYNVLKTKNWSTNCDLPAACFLTPVHSAQVAIALQVVNFTQSKFAVRTAGHNPNVGFAGVGAEGVTIDTQGFTTLSLSADKSTATVGAGLRFGDVQSFLDSQGVAVVSGRNLNVGVSGLLLGGGHPIINSLTGLAADNIQSAEVVLSNFKVVTASRTQNADLFKALKGGFANFGIVTKWALKTTMPRNIWYRTAVYGPTDPRAVLDAFVAVQKNMETDPKAGIQATASPAGFTVAFVYGEYTNDPAVFAPFRSLTTVSETVPPTNGTTVGFITAQTPPQPEASRDTVGVTTYLDTDLYVDIYNKYLTAAAANGNAATVFLLPIQTFGSSAAQIANANGGNVLGTTAKAQTWFNPIAQWTNPADDAKVHQVLTDLAASIRAAAQAKGLLDKYIFGNIASRDQQVLASYGQTNLDYLKTVSRKYDALQTFQKLQNAGFLVSKAG